MTLCPLHPGQQQGAFIRQECGWEKPPQALLHTQETSWSLGPEAGGVGVGGGGRPPTPGWEEPFGDAPGFCGVAVRTDHGQVADLGSAWSGAARGAQDLRSLLKGLGWLSQDYLRSPLGVEPGSFPGPWPGLWLGRPHEGKSGFSPHRGGRGLPPRDVPSDLAVTWVPTPDVHTHSRLRTSTHSCACTHSPTLQHTCSCLCTCTHLTFTPPTLTGRSTNTPVFVSVSHT